MKFVLKSSQMYIFNVHVSIDINCLLTNTSRWRLSYLDLLLEFSASTCFSAFSIQSYWMARRGARDVKNEKSNIFFPISVAGGRLNLGKIPRTSTDFVRNQCALSYASCTSNDENVVLPCILPVLPWKMSASISISQILQGFCRVWVFEALPAGRPG